ncbi:MAG TPA: alpha/beta hydrolase-fold protein [Pyrinomonadaceae bacterium]|nr:alpha/beta hydrolase-fold protein [Pyrinomonadaceae bacterium]
MKVRTNHFSPLLALILATLLSSDALAQAGASGRPTAVSTASSVAGELRLHQLKSQVFGNARAIRVLLPHGYGERANRKRRYPVLYLNDGQNLFDVATSIFNPMEWQADETVGRLIGARDIEPVIVVGIDNAGRSGRANEYLPFPDIYLRPPLANPEGSKYPEFLTREVMPFINARYRTRTGSQHTALGGSSYGALVALYTVIKKPGVFGRLLLESPSLYVSDARIVNESQSFKRWPRRIFIGVGTNEDGVENCKPGNRDQEAVRDVLKLERIIRSAGGARLDVLVEDCTIHNEAAWAKRLPHALKFLYGR